MKRIYVIPLFCASLLHAQFGKPDPTFGLGDVMNQIQQGEGNLVNALGNLGNTALQKFLFPPGILSTCNVDQSAGTGLPPGQNQPPGTAPTTGTPVNITPPTTAVPSNSPPPAPMPMPAGGKQPCGSRTTSGTGVNNYPNPNSSTSGGPPNPPSTPTTPTSPFVDTVVTEPPEEDPPDEGTPLIPSCSPKANTPVYRVDHAGGTVQRTLQCDGLIKSVTVTSRPLQAALTPDGAQLLVTSYDNAITFIDTASLTVSGVIQTDPSINPSGIAIAPDGSRAYVTSFNTNNPVVMVVDIASRRVTQTFQTGPLPQSAFLTPDGQLLFITCPFQNTVYVYDTLTNNQTAGFGVTDPVGIGFSPNGARAYIAAGGGNGALQVVDTSTFTIIKTIPLGNTPEDVLVSQDGRLIYVTNGFDGSITQVVGGSWQTATFKVGANVHGLSWVE